jgi:hypothetical protein
MIYCIIANKKTLVTLILTFYSLCPIILDTFDENKNIKEFGRNLGGIWEEFAKMPK